MSGVNIYIAPDGSIYVVDKFKGLYDYVLWVTDYLARFSHQEISVTTKKSPFEGGRERSEQVEAFAKGRYLGRDDLLLTRLALNEFKDYDTS